MNMELGASIYCKAMVDEVNGKPSESKHFLAQYLSSSSQSSSNLNPIATSMDCRLTFRGDCGSQCWSRKWMERDVVPSSSQPHSTLCLYLD